MKTLVERIDLAAPGLDLRKTIQDVCDIKLAAGLKLVATFVFGTNLVLIFQP